MPDRDIYTTPNTSPQDTRSTASAPALIASGVSMSDEEDDEDDAYYSLDDEESGVSSDSMEGVLGGEGEKEKQREKELEARETERRRVLEAAGLVVSPGPVGGDEGDDGQGGSRNFRSLSASGSDTRERKPSRRPAPPAPPRRRDSKAELTRLWTKDLPPIPTLTIDLPTGGPSPGDARLVRPFDHSMDNRENRLYEEADEMGHLKTWSDASIVHPDDAFERYEAFKKMQESHPRTRPPSTASTPASVASRLSKSSFDAAPTSPPKSPAASMTPSLRERRQGSAGTVGGSGGDSRTSQFFSFLGRHTWAGTPDIVERDSRKLVISGPIRVPTPSPVSGPLMVGGEGGPTREDSDGPAFGSSWASLVDRSALEGIPKEERKRQEAIFELIFTEADYVRDVQLIVELFYSRLVDVLQQKDTEMIFLNIEDILLTNTTFLSTLEERQRDCRLYIDRIGDLLEKHMPNMAVYLNYCVNQANAGEALRRMRESNPALAAQLQTLREDPSARNLDLSSYLLVPMQRLTRYPLLIRQILNYTDHGSPLPEAVATSWSDIAEKQSISTALETAEKILGEVNESIRDREGKERLKEISRSLWIGQGRLDLTAPTRHLGPRKLLREGVLSKARSGRKLRVLLCNDILVLVDEAEQGLYRVPIPVNEIKIRASRIGREDPLVRLNVAYPRGGDMIVLRATNIREAKLWGDAILEAGRKARECVK